MSFVEKRKKKFKDRLDGHRLKKVPVINTLMTILYPNRCDNEVFSTEEIDITNLLNFIKEHNEKNKEHPIKLFHCILAATTRVLNERRKLLLFINNSYTYERDEIKLSFIAKKEFADGAEEAIISYIAKGTDNVESISDFVISEVNQVRKTKDEKKKGKSTEGFASLPHFILKIAGGIIKFFDNHGKVFKSVMENDPSYSTAMLSNLGSIKHKSVYHHLNNYGSCSMIFTIGEIYKKKIMQDDGTYIVRDYIDITSTFDERIADGFYFIKSLKLLEKYLSNPETLLKPFEEEVNFELLK